MSAYHYRQLQPQDRSGVAEAFCASFSEVFARELEQVGRSPERLWQIGLELLDQHPVAFGAFQTAEPEKLQGFVLIDPEHASVPRLYVHPEHQGFGLGSELMQRAEEYLLQLHPVAYVEVASANPALAWYVRRGWQRLQPGDDAMVEGDRTVDIPVWRLSLSRPEIT